MANVSRPRGFVPLRHLDGSPFNGQVTLMYLPATDGVAVFKGDVVKWGGSAGTAGLVVSGMDAEGIPSAASFTAAQNITVGDGIAGVVAGFVPDYSNLSTKYRVASTARLVWVITDPTVVYEVEESGTSLAAADVGLNTSFTTTAGSTTTGISAFVLTNGSKNTTSTLPVKIMGLVKRPDNAFATASDPAKFEVIFNASGNSFGGAGIAGV